MIVRNCDLCTAIGVTTPATVDAKTRMGPWAYMCDAHNHAMGTGFAGYTNVLANIGKPKPKDEDTK